MIELQGPSVLLRGFRPEEVDLALERMAAIPPEIDDQRLRERQQRIESERRERIERSGALAEWEILLAIEADGRLVGDVQGRCPRYAMPPGVWEIGIELWAEADRGRGLGREAVRLLSSHLFQEEAAIRVQATTDLDNVAMRRALEALRFGFEGVLRGFMPSPDGPPRDYAMYGLTRDDWDDAKESWTRTS